MTQAARILDHLQSGHTLTAIAALNRYGCLRLAARIAELRADGHNIRTVLVRTPGGKRVAQYAYMGGPNGKH